MASIPGITGTTLSNGWDHLGMLNNEADYLNQLYSNMPQLAIPIPNPQNCPVIPVPPEPTPEPEPPAPEPVPPAPEPEPPAPEPAPIPIPDENWEPIIPDPIPQPCELNTWIKSVKKVICTNVEHKH